MYFFLDIDDLILFSKTTFNYYLIFCIVKFYLYILIFLCNKISTYNVRKELPLKI